ncbi:PDP protein [Sulfurimonas sp.]|uniref:MotE family protein n=1 Tax=Sulfurimonas sp. TaxID=2022749 RepID=UPI0025D03072|nr:PDP protein [Sulfurimonas sp.]MDD5157588.1 PDP protein [Sulfurimonas sp.]
MKLLLLTIFIMGTMSSLWAKDKLFECTEIFKARKSELLVELERLDEQKQAISSLKSATEDLLRKKETKISQEDEVVSRKLAEVKSREESTRSMLKRNEEILKEIKSKKMNNITQTFSKMKEASAARVLENMEPQDAAEIMALLNPKAVGKILTKMDPKKASSLTLILSRIPQNN